MLASEYRRVWVVYAITADRVIDLKVIALTHVKVFKTMCWRGMHTACACLSGHMIAEDNRYRCLIEGGQQ